MAVLPEYRESYVLAFMAMKLTKVDWVKNCGSWMSDTTVKAEQLTEAYVKMGYQIVDMVSWETTNYYSYVFRRPNKGKVFSDRYVRFRFTLGKLRCKLLYTEDGKRRLKGFGK